MGGETTVGGIVSAAAAEAAEGVEEARRLQSIADERLIGERLSIHIGDGRPDRPAETTTVARLIVHCDLSVLRDEHGQPVTLAGIADDKPLQAALAREFERFANDPHATGHALYERARDIVLHPTGAAAVEAQVRADELLIGERLSIHIGDGRPDRPADVTALAVVIDSGDLSVLRDGHGQPVTLAGIADDKPLQAALAREFERFANDPHATGHALYERARNTVLHPTVSSGGDFGEEPETVSRTNTTLGGTGTAPVFVASNARMGQTPAARETFTSVDAAALGLEGGRLSSPTAPDATTGPGQASFLS